MGKPDLERAFPTPVRKVSAEVGVFSLYSVSSVRVFVLAFQTLDFDVGSGGGGDVDTAPPETVQACPRTGVPHVFEVSARSGACGVYHAFFYARAVLRPGANAQARSFSSRRPYTSCTSALPSKHASPVSDMMWRT